MASESRRDVFQAIADPTRRQIIELVADHAMNLNSIAEHFDLSRPAISQQVRILEECGIIIIKKKGRERYCSIQPLQLQEAADWIQQYKDLWESKLDSFENYLAQIQTKKKHK